MLMGLQLLLPEIILTLTICTCLMVTAFAGNSFKMRFPTFVITPILLAIIIYIFLGLQGGGIVFEKEFLQIDGLSQYGKFLTLLILIGSIIAGAFHLKQSDFLHQEHRADYFPILLLSALGICVMISAADLITLYMGLELQSLALYIMIAFRRDNAVSTEAALKYLILGAVGSGLFLFGTSLIYGISGSVHYSDIYHFEVFIGSGLFLVIGIVLILTALLFKLSAAPFHMWTPDVYQGTPTFITAFIATAPKIAAVISLIRLVEYTFSPSFDQISNILILSAILSLVIGAIMAIQQKSIYRMIAYSTITHIGYILLCFSTNENTQIEKILEYLTIYIVTSFGLFISLSLLSKAGKKIDSINDLKGLGVNKPFMGFLISVFMFSLAGIPPLAGFFVKFNVLISVIEQGYITYAVIAILASAISAFYYIRIVKIIYFDDADTNFDVIKSKKCYLMSGFCALPIILYVINPIFIHNLILHFDKIFQI